MATKIALSTGCLIALAGAVSAASPTGQQDTQHLYELTVSSARALQTSPFDRPANQRLREALSSTIDAFSFDTAGNYKGVLLNCEYAARQLVVILDEAILSERPASPARTKLMLQRATEWTAEMEGCRRFLKARPAQIDMRAIARRIAGN